MKSQPVFASIILHMLVFLCIACYFDFSSQLINAGKPSIQVMHSYIYQHQAAADTSEIYSASRPVPLAKQKASRQYGLRKVNHAFTPSNVTLTSKNKPVKFAEQASSLSQGQPLAELIALLHAAIQKKQHYPLSALSMEREGRVTVRFTLYKNGTVSDLQIVKSSGTTSLDEAALAAVYDAVPFSHVEQYVQQPRVYRIDVAFELTG